MVRAIAKIAFYQPGNRPKNVWLTSQSVMVTTVITTTNNNERLPVFPNQTKPYSVIKIVKIFCTFHTSGEQVAPLIRQRLKWRGWSVT